MNKTKKLKHVRIKKSLRKFAITELKRIGVSQINGKPLSYSKNKVLFSKYKEHLGCIITNHSPMQKSRDIARVEIKREPTKGYVYFIGNKEYGFCKIGFSKKPHARMLQIQTGSPFMLEMFGFIEGTTKEEKSMHRKFAKYRSHGEWFLLENELQYHINNL
jgi:hypothetical protein